MLTRPRRTPRASTDLLALSLLDQLITLLLEDLGDPRAASRLLQLAQIPLNKLTGQPLPPYTSDPGLARAYLRLRRIVRQLQPGTTMLPEPTPVRRGRRPPHCGDGGSRARGGRRTRSGCVGRPVRRRRVGH